MAARSSAVGSVSGTGGGVGGESLGTIERYASLHIETGHA